MKNSLCQFCITRCNKQIRHVTGMSVVICTQFRQYPHSFADVLYSESDVFFYGLKDMSKPYKLIKNQMHYEI